LIFQVLGSIVQVNDLGMDHHVADLKNSVFGQFLKKALLSKYIPFFIELTLNTDALCSLFGKRG